MSRFLLCLAAAAGLAVPADLASLRTVYLLPMSNGLDQYLANKLTADSLFEVVTDPKLADAVFTDNIGSGFERRLEELLPSEEKLEERKAKEQEGPKAGSGFQVPQSTWSRGRGNVFLVDLKTRRVVWSVYERPKQTTPDELDKTSGRIALSLKKAHSPNPSK
ncbi:MAG: hypothetical protein R2729_23300 [Bryobacteraceae bacterium]